MRANRPVRTGLRRYCNRRKGGYILRRDACGVASSAFARSERVTKLFGFSILAMLHASLCWGQLAPYNKIGVTWGHVHLHPMDRYKETLALLSLGGQLGN